MIENEPNEITLIFHSDKEEDKKMRAFVETISTYKTKTLDLKRDSLTETQLAEIATKMKVSVSGFVNQTYIDRIHSETKQGIQSMTDNDILTLNSLLSNQAI